MKKQITSDSVWEKKQVLYLKDHVVHWIYLQKSMNEMNVSIDI